MGSAKNYEAYRIRLMMETDSKTVIPEISQLVKEVILGEYEKLKREEIIQKVATLMGQPVDTELINSVAGHLNSLEKKGIIAHANTGYWIKQK